jgi:hypothetical protein
LTEHFLRGALGDMKLLDQYAAAYKVRRLSSRTIQTYRRWVEEILRFHRDRTGQCYPNRKWIPFSHRAVNRHMLESTQNQALGAVRTGDGI